MPPSASQHLLMACSDPQTSQANPIRVQYIPERAVPVELLRRGSFLLRPAPESRWKHIGYDVLERIYYTEQSIRADWIQWVVYELRGTNSMFCCKVSTRSCTGLAVVPTPFTLKSCADFVLPTLQANSHRSQEKA